MLLATHLFRSWLAADLTGSPVWGNTETSSNPRRVFPQSPSSVPGPTLSAPDGLFMGSTNSINVHKHLLQQSHRPPEAFQRSTLRANRHPSPSILTSVANTISYPPCLLTLLFPPSQRKKIWPRQKTLSKPAGSPAWFQEPNVPRFPSFTMRASG